MVRKALLATVIIQLAISPLLAAQAQNIPLPLEASVQDALFAAPVIKQHILTCANDRHSLRKGMVLTTLGGWGTSLLFQLFKLSSWSQAQRMHIHDTQYGPMFGRPSTATLEGLQELFKDHPKVNLSAAKSVEEANVAIFNEVNRGAKTFERINRTLLLLTIASFFVSRHFATQSRSWLYHKTHSDGTPAPLAIRLRDLILTDNEAEARAMLEGDPELRLMVVRLAQSKSVGQDCGVEAI